MTNSCTVVVSASGYGDASLTIEGGTAFNAGAIKVAAGGLSTSPSPAETCLLEERAVFPLAGVAAVAALRRPPLLGFVERL